MARTVTVTLTYTRACAEFYANTLAGPVAAAVARAVRQTITGAGEPTIRVTVGDPARAAVADAKSPIGYEGDPDSTPVYARDAGAGSGADSESDSESGNLPGAGAGPYCEWCGHRI